MCQIMLPFFILFFFEPLFLIVFLQYTVWKFHNFSITQILREINFGDSRSAKSAILGHFEALNFDFYEFWHFLKAEIT